MSIINRTLTVDQQRKFLSREFEEIEFYEAVSEAGVDIPKTVKYTLIETSARTLCDLLTADWLDESLFIEIMDKLGTSIGMDDADILSIVYGIDVDDVYDVLSSCEGNMKKVLYALSDC